MSYKYILKFLPSALREWKKLDSSIQSLFKNKLKERLNNPKVKSDRLRGFQNHYKIKIKSAGYRLVYEIEERKITVLVIAVGKRDKFQVYVKAKTRT